MYYEDLGYEHIRKTLLQRIKFFTLLFFHFVTLTFQVKLSWCPTTDQTFKTLSWSPALQRLRNIKQNYFCQVSNQAALLSNKFCFCLSVLLKPYNHVADVFQRPDFTFKPVWPLHLISLHLLSQCTWTKGKYDSWQLQCLDRQKKKKKQQRLKL